jgi:hypothetical protein
LGHSGHSRVQLQAPLAWLDLRVKAEELLQEEALGLGVMASGVKVATITRFFFVDKRSEEEKAADRKSALAKWRDEENARLARKKEAEAAAEAKRLASKRPVGRPKKVRHAQVVLIGQEGEEGNLEDGVRNHLPRRRGVLTPIGLCWISGTSSSLQSRSILETSMMLSFPSNTTRSQVD